MGRVTKERYEVETRQVAVLDTLKKSNTLINAKGRSTLLQQKLFTIGLKYVEFSKDDNAMVSRLCASQLRRILGVSGNSLYANLTSIIMPPKGKGGLTDWKIVYRDDESQELRVVNVIQEAHYKDGELFIRYNSGLSKYLDNLLRNYTVLPLDEIMPLQSMYSFRMYEVLKGRLDYERAVKKVNGPIEWDVDIVELKLLLGIIDAAGNGEIYKALRGDKYDLVEDIDEKQPTMYADYSNFRKRALDPAVDEINEKTSLKVSYTPIRSNRKVRRLIFTIDSVSKAKTKAEQIPAEAPVSKKLTDDEILEIMADARAVLDREVFTISDVRSIVEAAEYDLEKVKDAVACLEYAGEVQNPTGWMISAVRKGYQKPRGKKKAPIYTFEKHDTDMVDLESKLIENL